MMSAHYWRRPCVDDGSVAEYARTVSPSRSQAAHAAAGSMEDGGGRCPTCESLLLGRRPLASSLLQVATLQAHVRTCDLRAPESPRLTHDAALASRALAAKRRESAAGSRAGVPEISEDDASPPMLSRTTSALFGPSQAGSRLMARRNTWCYASGTSAVAIDNKIEQAMDLVKSHLMFAVREEVEVLKERIAELMERITQLEVENTYLRAHASQDTLAQLPAAGAKPAALPPAGPPPPAS